MASLAPTRPAGLSPDAGRSSARATRTTARRAERLAGRRRPWWLWLDFESKLHAQVWLICCAQIVILVVGGLVIHASAASPY